jgi:hypothetical protein
VVATDIPMRSPGARRVVRRILAETSCCGGGEGGVRSAHCGGVVFGGYPVED